MTSSACDIATQRVNELTAELAELNTRRVNAQRALAQAMAEGNAEAVQAAKDLISVLNDAIICKQCALDEATTLRDLICA